MSAIHLRDRLELSAYAEQRFGGQVMNSWLERRSSAKAGEAGRFFLRVILLQVGFAMRSFLRKNR